MIRCHPETPEIARRGDEKLYNTARYCRDGINYTLKESSAGTTVLVAGRKYPLVPQGNEKS